MSWMNLCYGRLLIDNHISECRPEYMRRFDPASYASMAQIAGVEAAMVYACDHNGNSYYPTRVGHQHANLDGRDLFGETVEALAERGIMPQAYYTVIYHNDAARRLPQYRMRAADGTEREGRYRFVCPNHPETVAFFQAQIAEILNYPSIVGLFIDMSFWPLVCVCDGCRRRYREECGGEIPERLDWKNPDWIRFQRFRERSMAGFAQSLTDFVHRVRPEISVTHQFSPVLHGWYLGQSLGIARASDYASGDFYGGRDQQRFGLEVFRAYSTMQPFEFMTSRCVSLNDHTSTKSDDELYLQALTTLSHSGAYLLIDAINPDGTLCADFYRRFGEINRKLTPFRAAVRRHAPKSLARIGVMFGLDSCVEPLLDGLPVRELRQSGSNMVKRTNPVRDEVLGIASLLTALHYPYRVIYPEEEAWETDLEAVILPNQIYLSTECCERLRRFAAAGGCVIATGNTSLFTPDGKSDGNFQLADLFGVDATGTFTDKVSYLAGSWFSSPVFSAGEAPLVKARPGARCIARVNLPDFPVDDPDFYASIHSNPPGGDTEFAGLVENEFGEGRSVYLYSALGAIDQASQREALEKIFARHLPQTVWLSRKISGVLEVTMQKSSREEALLFGLVNVQKEQPNLPIRDLTVELALPEGFLPVRLNRVSDGAAVDFRVCNGHIAWTQEELLQGELFECWKGDD